MQIPGAMLYRKQSDTGHETSVKNGGNDLLCHNFMHPLKRTVKAEFLSRKDISVAFDSACTCIMFRTTARFSRDHPFWLNYGRFSGNNRSRI